MRGQGEHPWEPPQLRVNMPLLPTPPRSTPVLAREGPLLLSPNRRGRGGVGGTTLPAGCQMFTSASVQTEGLSTGLLSAGTVLTVFL